jgi:hypothetical protein
VQNHVQTLTLFQIFCSSHFFKASNLGVDFSTSFYFSFLLDAF